MRQASADLFPTDRPIPASQMIGRADDVREVAATLMAGASLVVAAPRRTGKTSVCDAALLQASRKGLGTVSVDLFRVGSAGELAEALVAGTIASRSRLPRIIQRAREGGRQVLDAAAQAVVVRLQAELGQELEIVFRPGLAERDPDRYLTFALELPERVAQRDDKRLILFLDEFQEVANPRKPYGDPGEVTRRMRAIFQRSGHVSFLFAGSYEHVMRDLFAPGDRAFSQFGAFYELRPIGRDEWRKGLAERFETDGCAVEPAAVDRVIELGEGHPRATMLIAQKSHLVSILLETTRIDLDLVEQGYQAALDGDRVSLEQAVEQIRRLHRLAFPVARRIADGTSPYRDRRATDVYRAIESLSRAGIIERAERRAWRIVNPLLARFLRDLEPIG